MKLERIKFDGDDYDSIIEIDENGGEIRVVYDGLDSRSAAIIIDLMYEVHRYSILLKRARQVQP